MDRRLLGMAVGLALAAQLAVAGGAHADGLGTLGITSTDGATSPVSGERLVAIPTGRGPTKGTTVERIEQEGGKLIDSRYLEQRLSIPAAAFDGTTSSLSADGKKLVLVPPLRNARPSHSNFIVLDAQRLTVRDRISLNGNYSFDAISPDGSRVYLIEYPSLRNTTEYSVRSYDLASNRLLRDPIVDPNEPPGEMQGLPMTRATSPDGRWAYTLYDGGGGEPFIHALDTLEGRAVCIDLEALRSNAAYQARLISNPDGSELTVVDHKRGPRAIVDTQTFEVSVPSEHAGGGGFPWLAVAMIPVALVAAWGFALVVRRRRHGVAPGDAQ